jgi:hypothetical protein
MRNSFDIVEMCAYDPQFRFADGVDAAQLKLLR